VVAATHDGEISRLADRVLELRDGVLVAADGVGPLEASP